MYHTEEGVELVTWYPQGTWSTGTPEPQTYAYARPAIPSLIEHYTGPNPSKGMTWTNFQHYKWWMAPLSEGSYLLPYYSAWPNTGDRYWLARFPTWFGWTQHSGTGSIMPPSYLYVPSLSGDIVSPPGNLEDLKQRAIKSIMPGIKAEMSVLNSLYELKDFRGMVRAVTNKVLRIRNLTAKLPAKYWGRAVLADLQRGWQRYIRSLQKESVGGLHLRGAGIAASNYLQWKFAIAPLIKDVQSARNALKSLEKKLNRLVTNEGRVRTGHWTTHFEEAHDESRSDPYSLSYPLYLPVTVASSTERDACTVETRFHCEIRYNYNLTNYQREHARMLSLMDAFGVNYNPAHIWNAIPFTFVLDWIIGVNQYLEQFNVGHMDPKINVLGALWSVLKTRKVSWAKAHYTPLPLIHTTKLSMPLIEEEAYRRQLFMPGSSSLLGSGLSSSEFTLGAALVTAIAARKARRK